MPELYFEGEYTQQHGYETTKAIFNGSSPIPTALFAMNGPVAAGALYALQELGLDVPGDVSVVSFDNPFQGAIYQESFVTVIDQKPYEIGYRAANLLLDYIVNKGAPRNEELILPVELMVRQSCRAISAS